ncbi:DUF192 domain-containing protein [Methanocella sp. MCL-LM]|uniref:DUF192 domain-containing protein n=1 Tax=Methanocella sp. MCL-LM TaxID=3412035 RepID=UPI003C773F99
MTLRKSDGTVIATRVEHAGTPVRQMIGLMFRRSIPQDYALIFDMRWEQYIGIHMLFVFFPIDLVYLDSNRQIVDLRHLRAWTGIATSKKPARYAIELPDGIIERGGLKVGDILDW